VVETDIGDNRDEWGDDVGTVKTTTQAHLNNSNVDTTILEVFEGHCGGYLEERGMQGFEERTLLLDEIDHIILTQWFPVYTDALTEIHQMG